MPPGSERLTLQLHESRLGSIAFGRLRTVREAIAQDPTRRLDMAELERLADMDRWSLARLSGPVPADFA
jgi:hypothetical protein